MLLSKKTKQEFNIDPEVLSSSSHKFIWLQCDYCGSEYTSSMKNRTLTHKSLPKDCCNKCKFKKREEVSLLKYGVKNSAQRKDVRKKLSNVNLEDYHTQIVELASAGFSSYKIAKKLDIPRSSLERYIHKNNINIIKNDRSITTKMAIVDKYGQDYKTILADRLTNTSKKLYGVENFFQSDKIKEKSKATCLQKYGKEFWIQDESNKAFAKHEELNSKIDSGAIRLYNGMTLSEAASKIGISHSHFIKLYNNHGLDYVMNYEKSLSNIETILKAFLEKLDIKFDYNQKLFNYYPDFKINSVIIECDGLYWHSDKVQQDNSYHYKKRNFYKKLCLKPLFFRSNEIENKFDIVCSIIKNALHLNNNKIHARKCEVTEISTKEAFEFCEKYHLMGGFKSSTHSLGLVFNGTLISVFQTKQLKNNSGQYDLSRFCTTPDTSIVGGFSKILSFFEKKYSPSMFQTFIDLRYGDGDYLYNLGFKEQSCYPSFQWTDGANIFHRMKFKGNSGYESGLAKIWDCGQRKMVKTY